jgi:hypothetical protein
MSWSIGFDNRWNRDIGYGVPAWCDYPGCIERIDRGLAHVCGGDAYGGERGCGLYFCASHLLYSPRYRQLCERCYPRIRKPFPAKPEQPEWLEFKATDESWAEWRKEQASLVAEKP